jgi:rod shape-determining protein MreB
VNKVIDAIKKTLERTPPELASDVISNGMHIVGGSALLAGLQERITHETGIQAFIPAEPLLSVIIGAGYSLDNLGAIKGSSPQGEE